MVRLEHLQLRLMLIPQPLQLTLVLVDDACSTLDVEVNEVDKRLLEALEAGENAVPGT